LCGCLAAIGFCLLILAVRQVAFPIGLAGLVMLIEELGGVLVHRGRLVVNGGGTLMGGGMPALMLVALTVSFAHNPSLSRADGTA